MTPDAAPTNPSDFAKALRAGQAALRQGDKAAARRWAWRALQLGPAREEAWLLLAATAGPRASVAYLQRALEINPQSQRARQGMHWAIRRLRAQPVVTRSQVNPPARQLVAGPVSGEALTRTHPALLPYGLLAIFILMTVAFFSGLPSLAMPALAQVWPGPAPRALAQAGIDKETRTPTPTNTPTFTPTPTNTPTPTATFTPTPTDTPTATFTPEPTATPKPKKNAGGYAYPGRPGNVGESENWIDVDLSSQRVYAYTGDTLQNSFIVSTGTWQHPTVTGTYRVYVKYRHADMSGPGYYLADVPYVMYFYKGYGLHGTYWHNNFGTPMSHGCVNLRTEEAGWLFSFASVGTVVHVHP